MPLALLLSPDDQAVSAITAVLEEMSVTCERPLDGASAAQMLNSNRFDLVLVDCENLPAAKLIFDVCRHRQGTGRPVPVAVVDGRAGLPTAFRLGAELILTKPVAKDQARGTIRTAISRVKREDSSRTEQVSTHESAHQAAITGTEQDSFDAKGQQYSEDGAELALPQERALAATAAAGSSSLTSFSDPEPAFSTTTPSVHMSASVAEPEVVEGPTGAGSVTATGTAARPSFSSAATAHKSPVEAAPAEESVTKAAAEAKAITAAIALTEEPTAAETKPVGSGSSQKRPARPAQKKRGRLVTLFVLLVACGGFYGAWVYEPGFQTLVTSQVNHLLVMLGMAPQPQQHPAPAPARPASQTAKPSAGVPVPAIAPNASQTAQPTPAASTVQGANSSTTPNSLTSGSPAAATQPAPASGTQTAATTTAQPVAAPSAKPTVTRIDLSPSAVAEPGSSGTKHAPSASAPKQPPPQH